MIIQDLIFGLDSDATNPIGGVWNKLARREEIVQNPQIAATWIKEAILELTRDYAFQQLQNTGPNFVLTPGVGQYSYADFLQPTDAIPNLVPSFFMYYDQSLTSGIGLKYKTIDSLEQMLSIQGTPAYWSRFANNIYLAPTPTQANTCFMRYQIQHPFPSRIHLPTIDPISLQQEVLLPDEWMDIVQYAAAERGAIDLRMLDYATQYHNILFGDPEFERTSGGKGQPGLIARRVSQLESDTTSQMRSIRVRR